ncbi:MAG: hypothetical protein ACI33P_02850 [Lysinibacillus sp.]
MVDNNTGELKGSKLLIRDYINNRTDFLNNDLLMGSPSLLSFINKELSITWHSPIKKDGYKEYRNEFLELVEEWKEKRNLLGDYWPRQGPQWDGVAVVQGKDGQKGLVFVEAKAHVNEMRSKSRAVDEKSKKLIIRTLEEVRQHFESQASLDIWLDRYYQLANRLAYLYILNEKIGIPTWLVFCNFTDDNTHIATDRDKWIKHYQEVFSVMDIRTASSRLFNQIVTIYPSAK